LSCGAQTLRAAINLSRQGQGSRSYTRLFDWQGQRRERLSCKTVYDK